jgi:hypothetical protein
MSTWPVASGVLVDEGVLYFAAGILNYDGIHVYALNAETGSIKWQNNTSGHLDTKARTGVSVQGHLLLDDGKLYLAGGTSVSPAVYDAATGECLNDSDPLKLCRATSARGQELYKIGDNIAVSGRPLYADPDYPVYDSTVRNKVLHTSAQDRDVVWINNTKILCFRRMNVALLNQLMDERMNGFLDVTRVRASLAALGRPLWEHDCPGSTALARSGNAILYAGPPVEGAPCIQGVDIATGKKWDWRLTLESPPVPWGLAVDREGRIIAALQDGQVMCFGPEG